MRFQDLTEEAPGKDIRNMITTIALSLVSSGREEVNLQSLIAEIKKRTNIDVPYNVMMDILNSLPFVQDANSDVVTFTGNDSESTGEVEQNSEDQVEDWATKAAVAANKQ
ncbi:hypothetical protein ACRYKS_20330 [Escherichia coli]|uniref:Uncharacterized protein n=1 Tax=Escherichia phage fEgEco12 TaxID=3158837 RepID=A0AAU7PH92_9CAUD|nr:hypothetical protein [Escherichia coli]QAY00413.1 structural protein [Escherichia phage Ecwhy_1]QXN76367.1 hypothetical protein [Escherichia phage BF17]WGM49622.1 virion structural protein [Escherichia phage vB_Ec-M-J]ELW0836300.1 hypothetical protein [Escherichia coli]